MSGAKQKVLILGGGFAGIKAALELEGTNKFNVTLLSDQQNFRYYPTLYNIALGKSHLGASIPLSAIFRDKKVDVVQGQMKTLDRDNKSVKDTNGKTYEYDVLIIALGVVTNFFGIKGLDKYAYGIKTLEEARRLRDHLHKQLIDEGKPDVNYVIIGGGPTGVELAGALPDYIKRIMKKHGLKNRSIHVDLVEAMPTLMGRMPKPYSQAVAKRLRNLGVKLYLSEMVKAASEGELTMSKHNLESHTVIWTAGVTNHPFFKVNNFELTDRGKVKVNEHLMAEPYIYVVGDNADTKFSGMAQTALFDGVFVASHLKRLVDNKKFKTYKPPKPIYVTPTGPKWAAVLWGKVHLYGWIGWILRESADLKGYSDYEPWWDAGNRFMAKDDDEESCPICFKDSLKSS